MPEFKAAVAHWPLDRLIPHARNARTHSEAQIAQIAGSVAEFGFVNPVLVGDDGVIVAGHGRVLAARKLGLATVPVIVLKHLTATQRRALMIADNKLALNAGWDEASLAAEIEALKGEDFDIDLLGFADDELAALFAKQKVGLTDPDDAPEPPPNPVSRLGDVWTLGRHRIVCGDCTDPLVVDKALAGSKPHLMVTDPPYGVEYDAEWRARSGVNAMNGPAHGKVLNDDRADWREAWALFPGAVSYVWHAGTQAGAVAASLEAVKFKLRAQIVWVKTRIVLSRGDYHHQHEPAFYSVREGADEGWGFVPEHEVATYAVHKGETGRWSGGRKQSTVWFIEHLKSKTGHSTQKPVACMQRPMENNSKAGDSVYEPFSGSGTTIIAAEITGRACHAVELSPAYVDVAIIRWQDFTGETAVLEGDGRTYGEIAASKKAA